MCFVTVLLRVSDTVTFVKLNHSSVHLCLTGFTNLEYIDLLQMCETYQFRTDTHRIT